jgi:histidyl-tRNA synthetase
MKFGRPRGTRDFLPPEMRIRRSILDKVRQVFEQHGFEEVLSTKGGDDVERQIYKFQDKGERWLGLRFDLTVPLARVVAGTPDLVKPFKRYNISKVWRYEEPQGGRFREFLQADIDIVGSSRMEADMECVSTAVDALKELGLEDFEVKMNDRKLLEGMVESLDIKERFGNSVFRALDKLEKIGEEGTMKDLAEMGLDEVTVEKITGFTRLKGEEALEYASSQFGSSKMTLDGIAELRRLAELSDSFGLSNLRIDFSLVRGLDYYTGPVFEVKAGGVQVGSVAGGGRYDGLIEKFGGPPTPATGISLGIERLYEVLFERVRNEMKPTRIEVFVANVNEGVALDAIRLSQELLRRGVAAEPDLMGRKLGRQLEYANSKRIPYVLVVGPDELKTKKFKLKDMVGNREIVAGLDQVVNIAKGQINE